MSINEFLNTYQYISGAITYDKMPSELISKLERISKRIYASHGLRLCISSHFRTPAQNLRCKGSPTSSHLSGKAVDIVCPNSAHRYALVQYALEEGVPRIGIYDRHIHLDVDFNKPHPVLWLGKSK